MSRGFPKSRHRPTSEPEAPFHLVLDRLSEQQGAPNGPVSPARAVPTGGWTYAAAEVAPTSSAAAAVEMYDHADGAAATPPSPPRSIEEAVAHELQLSDHLQPADLDRIRRVF